MDPDTTLQGIRSIIVELSLSRNTDNLLDLGEELASAVTQLDEWLKGGGFLPSDWDEEALS